jgi:hypothetical protein
MISATRTPRAPVLVWWLVLDDTTITLTDSVPEKSIDARAGRRVLEKIGFPI